MTDDDILQMAREAGGTWEYRRTFPVACVMYDDELIKFAELVAAREREVCAQVCEQLRDEDGYESWGTECAAAIRARGRNEGPMVR